MIARQVANFQNCRIAGWIDPAQEGFVINVRVIPRASRSAVVGTRGNALLVRLNAPPIDGAANAELTEVIANVLQVPKRAVSIIAGERSREKRVRVAGVDAATADARLRGTMKPPTVD